MSSASSHRQTADVIILGGGVIGCAVAYELARRSVDVLLIDKSLPGRASSASAGGLWPLGESVGLGCGIIHHKTNSDADDLEGVVVLPDAFRDFLLASNAFFPVLAEELRELSKIDIEYDVRAGLLFVCFNERDAKFVERITAALPANAQLDVLSADEVHAVEPQLTTDLYGAAQLAGEHQVNPMLLTEAFKRAAMALGVRVRHDTCATGIRRHGDRIMGVEIGDEVLDCETVINAAGAWAGKLAATANLHVPVFPVRGQIVLTQELPHTLNTCLSTSGCYLLQKKHGEVLIGSTTERAGFDVSVTEDAITKLCRQAIRCVPRLKHVGIKRIWSGLRPGTSDELPILGPISGVTGYLNATGGFRTGIVASPLTARLVAQYVVNEPLEVPIEPYLADRFDVTTGSIESSL